MTIVCQLKKKKNGEDVEEVYDLLIEMKLDKNSKMCVPLTEKY